MKQLGELTVADVMSEQLVTVKPSDPLDEAVRVFDDYGVSAIPVVDSVDVLVGILTVTDLVEVTNEIQADLSCLKTVDPSTRRFLIRLLIEQGGTKTVADVMTKPVETVEPQLNLVLAAHKILDRRCHHLPVVDPEGQPIGILSTIHFVRAFADQAAKIAG